MTRRAARAVSIVETLAAVTIIGIASAAVAPVMSGATDVYVAAARVRGEAESAAFALDRITRALREAPLTPGSGAGIATAAVNAIELADGAAVRLDGSRVLFTPAGGIEAVLAEGASSLTFRYIGADGLTSTSATPEETVLVEIDLALTDVRLVSRVWLRTSLGVDP